MTQKFHENETATIALYKYHQLLDCEQKLNDLRADVDWDNIASIKQNLIGSADYYTHESAASLRLLIGYLIDTVESMKF